MLISIKKIYKNSAFLGSDKPRTLLVPLINVKIPFNIYEQEKFHAQLSMKNVL